MLKDDALLWIGRSHSHLGGLHYFLIFGSSIKYLSGRSSIINMENIIGGTYLGYERNFSGILHVRFMNLLTIKYRI